MESVLYMVGHAVALVIEAIAIVVIATAAIRTFLSYFLDREVESTQRLQQPAATVSGARPMLRDARPEVG